jgi:hypothetical protein
MAQNNQEYQSDLKQFREVLPKVNGLEGELHAHEVQCEERWKTCFYRLGEVDKSLERIEGRLDSSMTRIEGRLLKIGGAVILFLAGLVVTLITMGAPV